MLLVKQSPQFLRKYYFFQKPQTLKLLKAECSYTDCLLCRLSECSTISSHCYGCYQKGHHQFKEDINHFSSLGCDKQHPSGKSPFETTGSNYEET